MAAKASWRIWRVEAPRVVEKDGTGNSSLFLSLLSKFNCRKVAEINLRNQKHFSKRDTFGTKTFVVWRLDFFFFWGQPEPSGRVRAGVAPLNFVFLPQWGCNLHQCGLPTASRWDDPDARLLSSPARRHLRVLHGGVDVVLPRRGCQWRVTVTLLKISQVSLFQIGVIRPRHFVFGREECSENNVSTTKYPCVKSTGEAATCYRWSLAVVVLVSGLKSLLGVYFGVMLHGGQLYGIKSTKGRLCNVSFKFFTDFFGGAII